MKNIDKKLDKELSQLICSWDHFEKSNNGEDIIDMKLVDEIPVLKSYQNRDEILRDIEVFLSLDEVRSHDVIQRKLLAHHYYLRQLMGENIPFDEYFKNTMGLNPVVFTQERITGLKNQLDEALDKFGLVFKENIQEDLNQKDKMIDPALAGKFMDEIHSQFYNKINEILDLNAAFDVSYSTLPSGHQYFAWISGNGKKFSVQLNHEMTHLHSVTKMKSLAMHELTAHAVQISLLRQKIEREQMPEFLGHITVHEPIQYAFEGLDLTLPLFFPDEKILDDHVKVSEILVRYNNLIFNNAAVLYCRGESSFENSLKEIHNHTSFNKDRSFDRLNYIATNRPQGYSYRQIYGISTENFHDILAQNIDRTKFIKSVYEDFLMPEQVNAQAQTYINKM